jgi:hypothetical protein
MFLFCPSHGFDLDCGGAALIEVLMLDQVGGVSMESGVVGLGLPGSAPEPEAGSGQ